MPVADSFLGRVPAEENDSTILFVWEVEKPHVQVLEEDAELPDGLYRQVEPVSFNAVLGANLPAAVRAGRAQDGSM